MPVAAIDITSAVGVTPTCTLLQEGIVMCWGLGPLGHGSSTISLMPVAVLNLEDVTRIADNCAVLRDGTIWCWGTLPVQTG